MEKKQNKKNLINDDFAIESVVVAYDFLHFRDNWSHNPGVVSMYLLPLIIDGEATLYFNEKPHKVKRGDIALISQGINYRSEGNIKFHTLDVKFTCPPDKMLKFSRNVIHIKDVEHYKRLYREIISIYETPKPFNTSKLMSLVYNLLWAIATEYSEEHPVHKKFHIIEKSIDYMNSNLFNNEVSIEDIAAKSGISVKYFRNIFKEIYGVPPIKYINDKRLSMAEEMLHYPNYPISVIAEHCGFSSSIYFDRMFKAKYGMSPIKYRQKQ